MAKRGDESFQFDEQYKSWLESIGNQALPEEEIAFSSQALAYSLDLEETLYPAVSLMLFNQLSQQDSNQVTVSPRNLKRIGNLNNAERKARLNPYIPTIGVEVEFPFTNNTFLISRILDILNIPNMTEEQGLLREANPRFSYSSLGQARIIQGLETLGVLIDDQPISLHVNFGVPFANGSIIESYEGDVAMLSNLLAYVYSSPRRIKENKYSPSFYLVKNASPSKRNNSRDIDSLRRIEFRAFEVRGADTFRMLIEAQSLVACLFSYIRVKEKSGVQTHDSKLSDVWKSLYIAYSDLMLKLGIPHNLIDANPVLAGKLMNNTNLIKESELLAITFARKIRTIISV